jgi:cell division protein ZapB
MASDALTALENKIDQLISLCAELNEENSQLKSDNAALRRQQSELLDRNQQARERVEATLSRLRAME